ncbi:hypothetical protein AVEN_2504-1 [Araneus ventricosus]|uniref:Uncharacterized protein n=1 Tax=Araneus ventricosus TaxID=182803 RepID=A0A4Y2GGL5_ARAVE|nr:hypothetical protein AVEN_2504-1 [Araneus ventricosus]
MIIYFKIKPSNSYNYERKDRKSSICWANMPDTMLSKLNDKVLPKFIGKINGSVNFVGITTDVTATKKRRKSLMCWANMPDTMLSKLKDKMLPKFIGKMNRGVHHVGIATDVTATMKRRKN